MAKTAKIYKVAAAILLLLFGGVLLIFPDRYIPVCFGGICLWAECVLPSLFPFMIITSLLISLGAADAAAKPLRGLSYKLKLPAAALPLFLMSVCSGYPAGSRLLYEYAQRGLLSPSDCKKLAPLCSACGPLFALGTVGFKAFGGGSAGVKLLCACLISVISTSLVFCLFCKNSDKTPLPAAKDSHNDNVLYSSFCGGVNASLVAGGFICFFYTLAKVLDDFKIFTPLTAALSPVFGGGVASAIGTGLCEATCGCFKAAAAGGFFALPAAGFLMTFGGVSIILQQLCYLTPCGVKAPFFIAFKFVQGIVCFALLCLFSLF